MSAQKAKMQDKEEPPTGFRQGRIEEQEKGRSCTAMGSKGSMLSGNKTWSRTQSEGMVALDKNEGERDNKFQGDRMGSKQQLVLDRKRKKREGRSS